MILSIYINKELFKKKVGGLKKLKNKRKIIIVYIYESNSLNINLSIE